MHKTMKTAVLALTLALVGAVFAAGDPEFAAKVKSGELKEAKASWWGFDPVDSTAALQAAIDSGAPKLIVDYVGQPWITNKLNAASNQEIVFEKGVVVEAKKGEFKGGGDSLLSVILKENVTLIGYGATLRMHRADYDDPALYKRAEWRHTLSIRSSRNVKVYGLTLALSGGDGIYLGVSKKGVTNQDIHIKDVVCDRHYRQGISVISARNLLIENTIMKDTAGTPPAAGIDFEPNAPSEELVNCVLRNCVSENNAGCGYAYYLPNLHADSAPLSLRLENCIARGGNSTDFSLATGNNEADTVGGAIEVVNCRFEKARGAAISISRKPVAGAAVRFKDCVLDSPAQGMPGMPPISITGRAGCRRTVGGVDFGKLLVIDSVERPFLDYYDWVGGSGVSELAGVVTVRRNGAETVQALTPEWLAEMFPARSFKQIPPLPLEGVTLAPAGVAAASLPPSRPFYIRKTGTFVFHAQAGDQVSMTFDHAQVGRYGGETLTLTAIAPAGRKVNVGQAPYKQKTELRFTAPETGLYQLPFKAGSNRLGIAESSHPFAVSGATGEIRFIGAAGDLFFLVPAGTQEFGLLIYGEGRLEAVKASVFDPSGEMVWEKDRITRPEMFAPERPPPAQDEVWRLRLSRPSGVICEDNYVDLRGIPPFLARDARALLKPQK